MGLLVWSVFHRAMDPLEERIRSWTGKAVLIIEPFFFFVLSDEHHREVDAALRLVSSLWVANGA